MKKELLVTALAGLISVSGCAKKPATEDAETVKESASAEAPQASSKCEQAADAEISAEDWTKANNDFGFNMLRKTSGSAVVSPYSAERALGMIHDGACGDTGAEMRAALSLPNAKNLSASGAEIEKSMLIKPEEGEEADPGAPVIHIDNRVWADASLTLKDPYVSEVKANYTATPTNVSFSGDPEAARKLINDDIAKSTEQKIQDLIPSGAINSLTRLVLTNAVYFKGSWKDNFNADNTKKEKFAAVDGEQEVDMMHHKRSHRVYQDDAMTAFEMRFNGNYSLIVMLPKVEDNAKGAEALAAVEKTLTADKLAKILDEAQPTQVNLSMPKFRIETSAPLTEMLKSLGMNKAFSTDADFSRMSNTELFVSSVLQKAYIDINENGAEAAAATAGIMMMRAAMPIPAEPLTITVDHPFDYVLIETSHNTAIFVGRVEKI